MIATGFSANIGARLSRLRGMMSLVGVAPLVRNAAPRPDSDGLVMKYWWRLNGFSSAPGVSLV